MPSTLIAHSLQSWNIKFTTTANHNHYSVLMPFSSGPHQPSWNCVSWCTSYCQSQLARYASSQSSSEQQFTRLARRKENRELSWKCGRNWSTRKVLCRPPLEASHCLVVTSSLFFWFPFRRCDVYVQTSKGDQVIPRRAQKTMTDRERYWFCLFMPVVMFNVSLVITVRLIHVVSSIVRYCRFYVETVTDCS